ncbi:MAG: 1-acyl-sn-glycerol-3-phosphate acyltransferase [Bauldia sp.]|nr:1-acyl-sn-glycerol-3-phosphate acyltransferase [Bauldia sp.]
MTLLRSILYNIAFYVVMAVVFIAVTPVYFFLPQRRNMAVVSWLARVELWLLRVIAGTRVEWRGVENLPAGKFIVASKHQSLWETFAFLQPFPNAGVIIKRQLLYVPIWGWWAWKADHVYVTRGGGTAALKEITEGAERVMAQGRPLVIFPEGTRRAPGAAPDYKQGIALLYAKLGVPVVPVGLNSGFYWPRRRSLRFPGTIVVEFLPPIPPGLKPRAFMERLTGDVERSCDRLVLEADAAVPRPPFPTEATKRLHELKSPDSSAH